MCYSFRCLQDVVKEADDVLIFSTLISATPRNKVRFGVPIIRFAVYAFLIWVKVNIFSVFRLILLKNPIRSCWFRWYSDYCKGVQTVLLYLWKLSLFGFSAKNVGLYFWPPACLLQWLHSMRCLCRLLEIWVYIKWRVEIFYRSPAYHVVLSVVGTNSTSPMSSIVERITAKSRPQKTPNPTLSPDHSLDIVHREMAEPDPDSDYDEMGATTTSNKTKNTFNPLETIHSFDLDTAITTGLCHGVCSRVQYIIILYATYIGWTRLVSSFLTEGLADVDMICWIIIDKCASLIGRDAFAYCAECALVAKQV